MAQLVKNPPATQETLVRFLVGKIHWRRDRPPTLIFLGFPGGTDGKASAHDAGEPEFDPWVGKIPPEKGMATHSFILPQRIP